MSDEISRVFMICTAYEQGMGHGLNKDMLPNPYPPKTDEFEAYDIGYFAGAEKRDAMFRERH